MDGVVSTLIDRVPTTVKTSAPGWRVARLPGLPYPGLVVDEEGEAAGRVYDDLTKDEWSVLDAFENPTYIIARVALRTGRHALAYVWPEPALPSTWSATTLRDEDLAAYLDRCKAWRSRREERSTRHGPS